MNPIAGWRLERSAQIFNDRIWPLLASKLGGGELVPVESVTDSYFAHLIDVEAGIDAWQVVPARGLRGIASRVQVGPCWGTWTIRTQVRSGLRTEWDKLLAEDSSLLRPAWHIQSYVESWHPDTQVNGAAAIRTADLISMLKQGSHEPERINPRDGTRFVAVRWATAILRGYEIEVIDA